MRHLRTLIATLLSGLVLAGAIVHATERRPLPPFNLTSLERQPVSSAELPREGNWLLIYVEPSCGSCMAVLNALSREEHPGLASRVTVIVAGATTEQAMEMAAAATEMSEASWLIDPDRAAGKALGVAHAPLIVGVRNSMIEWGLTGAFQKNVEMQRVFVSWLAQAR